MMAEKAVNQDQFLTLKNLMRIGTKYLVKSLRKSKSDYRH